MTELGVGVVGVGMMGRRHAEILHRMTPGARLLAVVDSDAARARQVAAEFGADPYSELEPLLQRKDVQAVVIASPAKFHAATVEAAAGAGKEIFCEKPLALGLEEADRALAAVARSKVRLQVGHMRRYDPAYSDAWKRIEAGDIGEPLIFKAIGRDRMPPPLPYFQSGVNATLLLDSSIHEFDLARWLMRDEVVEVHTFAGVLVIPELKEFGDLDAAVVNLRFARGGLGNVESFRQARYGYDIRTEIIGSKGTLRVGYLRQTADVLLTEAGGAHDVVGHYLVRFADAYVEEMKDFVEMLRSGREPRVTGEDGRRALAIALAAQRSHRERRPIALS
jgi:scyllo-inositol 2-dehydrogenase (NAD+)